MLLEVVASSRRRLLQQEPDCSTAVSNPAAVEHGANSWAWSLFLPNNLLFFNRACVCMSLWVCVCPQPAHPEGSRLSLESVSLRWRQTINLLSQPDFRVVPLRAWRFGSKEKQPCVKKKTKKTKIKTNLFTSWTSEQANNKALQWLPLHDSVLFVIFQWTVYYYLKESDVWKHLHLNTLNKSLIIYLLIN